MYIVTEWSESKINGQPSESCHHCNNSMGIKTAYKALKKKMADGNGNFIQTI